MNKTLFFDWGIPLFLLAAIAPFTPELDLAFAKYFFNHETGHFSSQPFFLFIYTWGLLPAQLVGVAAIFLFLLTYCKKSFAKWRKLSLMIILTIGIGAGVLTHVIFKETWNRPRPRQIEQFRGTEPFRPFYEPQLTIPTSFKSFPSGHCAMGFCFFAFVIYGRRIRNRPLMIAGTALAVVFGITLSVTRISQ
ncbi:MAG: phosphatase PAP2 family protein, partial [Parachlamydiaceae bacterium]